MFYLIIIFLIIAVALSVMPLLRLFYDITINKAGKPAQIEYLIKNSDSSNESNSIDELSDSNFTSNSSSGFQRPIAVVTGSNVGIGLETARSLWLRGYIVIMACRSIDRAQEARDFILDQWKRDMKKDQLTHLNPDNLIIMKLDLGDLDSVKEFSDTFRNRFNYVTVIVSNAGLISSIGKETKQGFEMTYGVCYLGHQLLFELLIPLMKKTENSLTPRIVILTSVMQKKNPVEYNKIYFKERMRISTWPDKLGRGIPATSSQYSFVKLLNLMQMKILHERFHHKGILVNAVHPGIVKSDISREYTNSFIRWIMSCIFLTAEQGCQTSVHVASAQRLEEENLSGHYWANCKIDKALHPFSEDSAMKRLLWNETMDQLKDYLPLNMEQIEIE